MLDFILQHADIKQTNKEKAALLQQKYKFKSFHVGNGFSDEELDNLDIQIETTVNYVKDRYNYSIDLTDLNISVDKSAMCDEDASFQAGYAHTKDYITFINIDDPKNTMFFHEYLHKIQYEINYYIDGGLFEQNKEHPINVEFQNMIDLFYSTKETKLKQIENHLDFVFQDNEEIKYQFKKYYQEKEPEKIEQRKQTILNQFLDGDYTANSLINIIDVFKKTSKKSLLTVIENYYDTNTYQKKYLSNPIEQHARISEMLMQIDLNEITPSLNYPEPIIIQKNQLKIEEFNKLLLHFHKQFKSQNKQCDTNKFGMMHL